MVKYFCDNCKEEKDVSERFVTKKEGDWKFEIQTEYKGTWNAGVLCQDCLKKLLVEAFKGLKKKL